MPINVYKHNIFDFSFLPIRINTITRHITRVTVANWFSSPLESGASTLHRSLRWVVLVAGVLQPVLAPDSKRARQDRPSFRKPYYGTSCTSSTTRRRTSRATSDSHFATACPKHDAFSRRGPFVGSGSSQATQPSWRENTSSCNSLSLGNCRPEKPKRQACASGNRASWWNKLYQHRSAFPFLRPTKRCWTS